MSKQITILLPGHWALAQALSLNGAYKTHYETGLAEAHNIFSGLITVTFQEEIRMASKMLIKK